MSSLSDIRRHFPPSEVAECNLYAPDGPVRHHVPRYLYRGECGLFPTTESSQLRLERSGEFNPKEQEALRKVVSALRSVFKQPDYDNTEADAEGLLEHYGVPSPIINFTSSPDIAAVFAAAADADAEYGRICILTRPYKGGAMVFDYRQHPFAVRAWRQMGFGVVPQGFTDLKSREADIRLGAIWVEFRISAADRAAVSPAYRYLLNASARAFGCCGFASGPRHRPSAWGQCGSRRAAAPGSPYTPARLVPISHRKVVIGAVIGVAVLDGVLQILRERDRIVGVPAV
jgi:hypothetical protein